MGICIMDRFGCGSRPTAAAEDLDEMVAETAAWVGSSRSQPPGPGLAKVADINDTK
jgi:hypothetical protein